MNDSSPTIGEVDAKIAAAEARTDTKIGHLEGKIDVMIAKLDHLGDTVRDVRQSVRDENRATRANQWGIAFGMAVLIIGVAALFPAVFGISEMLRSMIDQAVAHAVAKPG